MSGLKMYDVVAVNMETGIVRLIDKEKTLPNAEAIINMCVARRVDTEFYAEVPTGKYKDGDEWDGK